MRESWRQNLYFRTAFIDGAFTAASLSFSFGLRQQMAFYNSMATENGVVPTTFFEIPLSILMFALLQISTLVDIGLAVSFACRLGQGFEQLQQN